MKRSNAPEVTQSSSGDVFMYLCLIKMADDEITVSVCVGKKTCVSCHSLIHSHRDSRNMRDSYLNRLLRLYSPYRDLI